MLAREREHEMAIQDKLIEFRKEVVACLKRNGIEGQFTEKVVRGDYDYKMESVIRRGRILTPVQFTKQLVCEVLH